MTEPSSTGPGDLSFDKAIPQGAPGDGADGGTPTASEVRCSNCAKRLTDTYHTANGEPICSDCRMKLQSASGGVAAPGLVIKASVFGFGAAVAGAVVYYALARFANLEWAVVTILCGWMVGKAMRAGANGGGGRLLQVIAALLVYVSVAMAYSSLYMTEFASPALAMPFIVIFSSGGSGIISAIILAVGIAQAWKMMAATEINLRGPFRVGGPPPT